MLSEKIWISVDPDMHIYQVGDRVAWCEGCYGTVIAKPIGGMLCIRTDDGIDRFGCETTAMKVDKELLERGIQWN